MADTILVKPHPSVKNRAFWDVDAAHPGGELYLAGQDKEPVEVVETAGIAQALADKRLVKVERARAAASSQAASAAKSAKE